MAIEKLELASIHFNQKNYHDVLLKLFQFKQFHPELASKFSENVAGIATYSSENVYEDITIKIEEMIERYHLDIEAKDMDVQPLSIIKVQEELTQLEQQVEQIALVKEQLQGMIEENDKAMIQLRHVAGMEINFDDLFSCNYLQVRFGKLPLDNVSKLDYYTNLAFTFQAFEEDLDYLWCMYVTTPQYAPEVDNVFASLFFERIYIPPFVHGQPELAIAAIQEESDGALVQSQKLEEKIAVIFEDHVEQLERVYSIALKLKVVNQMQKYIVVIGDTLTIYGFIKKRDHHTFLQLFEESSGVHVDITPASSDGRLTPPTLIRNNWFVEPFKLFVEMYGSPSYHEVDPTVFVALSYTLLFGMMFGDVGQGILLSLFGYIAYKKKGMELGRVGIRLGLSSTIFGFIFGSLFGNEEILHGLFHPMDTSNTMTLLLTAVGIGVVFIVISMVFNIIILCKRKQIGEALVSQSGVCGLVFYVSTLGYVLDLLLGFGYSNGLYVTVLMVIPILCVFAKEPIIHKLQGKDPLPHGIGGFFMEGFFELFEVVLSYITNTMSFLRVGGFVLSHAGMMLVVYTLANMVGGTGYYIVLVFGNLFVMGLEGLIVGIQVLRLEFYEMFSRYYQGNGILFRCIQEERN